MKAKRKYMFKITHKSYYNKYSPDQVFESILFLTLDGKTNKYKAIGCTEHGDGQIRHTQSPETMDNTWIASFLLKPISYQALMRRIKKPTKHQTTERFDVY